MSATSIMAITGAMAGGPKIVFIIPVMSLTSTTSLRPRRAVRARARALDGGVFLPETDKNCRKSVPWHMY